MKTWKLFLTILLALTVTACSGRVDFRLDDNYSYITITLTEQEVADLIEQLLTTGSTPVLRSASADLRPGEIYVSGEVIDQNGGTLPGSLSVQIWTDQGLLQAAITSFNFAGYTADQAAIDRFNRDLAAGLAQSNADNTSESDISALTIGDDSLSFTIRTPR